MQATVGEIGPASISQNVEALSHLQILQQITCREQCRVIITGRKPSLPLIEAYRTQRKPARMRPSVFVRVHTIATVGNRYWLQYLCSAAPASVQQL